MCPWFWILSHVHIMIWWKLSEHWTWLKIVKMAIFTNNSLTWDLEPGTLYCVHWNHAQSLCPIIVNWCMGYIISYFSKSNGILGCEMSSNYFNCCLCKITFLIKINFEPHVQCSNHKRPSKNRYCQHKIKFNVHGPNTDHWFIPLKRNDDGYGHIGTRRRTQTHTNAFDILTIIIIIWIWFFSILFPHWNIWMQWIL